SVSSTPLVTGTPGKAAALGCEPPKAGVFRCRLRRPLIQSHLKVAQRHRLSCSRRMYSVSRGFVSARGATSGPEVLDYEIAFPLTMDPGQMDRALPLGVFRP